MDTLSALAMMNPGILLQNLKEIPRQLKPKQMLANIYAETMDFPQNKGNEPMDLSRLCDSVESRTTLSPYNSSGCGDLSPNLLNESQTLRDFSMIKPESSERTRFPFDQPYDQASIEHHFMRGQSINSDDEMDISIPALALQRTLMNMPDAAVVAAAAAAAASNIPSSASSSGDPLSPIEYPIDTNGKTIRPFKSSFPYDFMHVTDKKSAEQFNLFRQHILDQKKRPNARTNPNMRRNQERKKDRTEHDILDGQQLDTSTNDSNQFKSESIRDLAYYERRHRNNLAAKKSRERRRIKEDEMAIRAAFLERENFQLKLELTAAKKQLAAYMEK